MNIANLFLTAALALALAACSAGSSDEQPTAQPVQARSGKRGLAFAFQTTTDVSLLAPGCSWSYNWSPDQDASFDQAVTDAQMDFCPMAWNGDFDSDRIRAWVKARPDCRYVLAFNEPNLTDQCNYAPAQAAAKYPRLR